LVEGDGLFEGKFLTSEKGGNTMGRQVCESFAGNKEVIGHKVGEPGQGVSAGISPAFLVERGVL